MRISDWSSDVCSSDLRAKTRGRRPRRKRPRNFLPSTSKPEKAKYDMTTNFKTAVKLQSGNIRSPRCRMSYPRLFTPQPDDKGTLFYTCSFLIYPDCDISLLKNEGAASVKEKFGDKVRSEEHTSELQSLMRI